MVESSKPVLRTRAVLNDSLFLTAIVFLSCAPYLRGLGLYSDDWGFFASFQHTDGSYSALVASVMMAMETRPVQAFVLAGLYWAFGPDTFAFHVFNSAVLAAAAVLFYLAMRLFGITRFLALAIPLIFGLLPHYSTSRFWIAAFQANVSVLLYFLSLFCDLRFVLDANRTRWLWKVVAISALVGSVLAYEITAALFLVNVAVLLYVIRRRHTAASAPQAVAATLGVAANALFLALAIAYKLGTTARADISGGYMLRALRIVREAVPVHFGEYGLALPLKAITAITDYASPQAIVASLVVALAVFAYFQACVRPATVRFEPRVSWVLVMLAGGLLFLAGYGVTLTTWEIGFHPTGANNRTAVGAAIGVAWVFAGVIGWISSRPAAEGARWVTFALLLALLSASSMLITTTVAAFWVDAARRQQVLIAQVRQQFPTLPERSTLLLDGLCPFDGPAPVFATDWDVTGMLRWTYDDPTLTGDVMKANTEATADGVRTLLFDDWINVYPYRQDLIVYHLQHRTVFYLTSEDAALRYLADVSDRAPASCQPYTDGDGTAIF